MKPGQHFTLNMPGTSVDGMLVEYVRRNGTAHRVKLAEDRKVEGFEAGWKKGDCLEVAQSELRKLGAAK